MHEAFIIGDFMIKPYLVDHSAFLAAAFEIQAEGKTVIYTGDFRGHGRRKEHLDRFLKEAFKAPDLLLIEGTTLGRTGEKESSEEELEGELRRVMETSRGIVLCQPAAQNIDRIISFYKAARACGKIFVMDLYTASLFRELKKLGHEELPVPSVLLPFLLNSDIRVYRPLMLKKKMERLLGRNYTKPFRGSAVPAKMIAARQKQIVMLVRPSMLPDLKWMKLRNGTLIYSQWQAYREKPYQLRFEEYLKKSGFADFYLHTSGHAFEEVIKKVITGLSPKEIVPIHTFCPEAFYSFGGKVTLRQDGVPFDL